MDLAFWNLFTRMPFHANLRCAASPSISKNRLQYLIDILVGEYIADFVLDGTFIVEIKAVSTWNPRHDAQAVHYLAATGMQLALLLNLGTGSLQHRRIIRTGLVKEKSV
jgi:hypothetical protein